MIAAGIDEIINFNIRESDSFSHLKSPLINCKTSCQTKINTAKKMWLNEVKQSMVHLYQCS